MGDNDRKDAGGGKSAKSFASALRRYASSNRVEDLAALLRQHPGQDLNARDEKGHTALHNACRNDSTDIIRQLSSKADWNARDNTGATPLHRACSFSSLEAVKLGIVSGADPNALTNNGSSPLIFASQSGTVEICDYLCHVGAEVDVRKKKSQQAAIWYASLEGFWEVVEVLIARGADVDSASKNGATPLNAASSNGHINVVKLLAENGADAHRTDGKGRSPVFMACMFGHIKVIKYLVDARGADLNGKNRWGSTPIWIACKHGQLEVLEYVDRDLGVDLLDPVHVRDSIQETLLHGACEDGHMGVVQHLVRKGMDVNAHDGGTSFCLCFPGQGRVASTIALAGGFHDIAGLLDDVASGKIDWQNVGSEEEKEQAEISAGFTPPVKEASVLTQIERLVVIQDAFKKVYLDSSGSMSQSPDSSESEAIASRIDRTVMSQQLRDCVDQHRDEIEQIFVTLQGIYDDIILQCMNDDGYSRRMQRFQMDSKENLQFQMMTEVFRDVHESGLRRHEEPGQSKSWERCVEELESEERDAGELKEDDAVFQAHTDDIAVLYGWSIVTQARLVGLVKRFSRLTNGKCFIEKGVKPLHRIKEKMILGDMTRLDMIWDTCRGRVTFNTLPRLVSALARFKNRLYFPHIRIFNVHNTFTKEPNGQYQDVTVHFVFLDFVPDDRVICELQLCYIDFTRARKHLGGHSAYTSYRNAIEIAQCVENRKQP